MGAAARNWLWVSWVVCLGAGACTSSHAAPPAGRTDGGGEGGSGPAGQDGGSSQVARLRTELLDTLCERKQVCAELHGFPYDDLADCVHLTDPWLVAGPSRGQVEGCVDALETVECEALALSTPEACKSLWLPRRPREGEQCDPWALCEEGTRCHYSGGECGLCEALRANGEDCDYGSQCASGRCEQARCAAPGGQGEPCEVASDCAGFCDEGTCRDFAPEGAACQRQVECASNRCDTGECVPFRVPRIGDPCETYCAASDHVVSHGTGLDCQGGKCVEAPGEGEACGTTCRLGYVCVEGTCEVRPEPGQGGPGSACDWRLDCRDDLICRPLTWRCTRPAQVGESCINQLHLDNGGCAADAYCARDGDDWLCFVRKADGEACDVHRECLSGFCDEDVCSESFCR